jgi:NitT/TauT family transport system ATP-binding protein
VGRESPAARAKEDRAPKGAGGAQSAQSAPSAHVTIRGLTKHFPDAVLYDRFDLDIPRGKLVSIFGPNGCGKSTLINMITGLTPTDAGEILFDGKPLRDIKFGYVFQNYREAMFPWLRAFDNIAYPLKVMGVPKPERTVRVERIVANLNVKIDLNLYPYQMSGGQQQLVSIMRALVVEPEILFLDEPFSALDYEMTLFMREQLQRVFMETATTTVLVSHDLEEAVYLSDRILLLSRHPARAVEFVHYDAPRPRTLKTMSEADFVGTKAHCLEVFQREVRKG